MPFGAKVKFSLVPVVISVATPLKVRVPVVVIAPELIVVAPLMAPALVMPPLVLLIPPVIEAPPLRVVKPVTPNVSPTEALLVIVALLRVARPEVESVVRVVLPVTLSAPPILNAPVPRKL